MLGLLGRIKDGRNASLSGAAGAAEQRGSSPAGGERSGAERREAKGRKGKGSTARRPRAAPGARGGAGPLVAPVIAVPGHKPAGKAVPGTQLSSFSCPRAPGAAGSRERGLGAAGVGSGETPR